MFKVRDAAFLSGDREVYRSARANLRRRISQAKHICKQRLEEHINSSEPLHIWHGTDFKLPSPVPLSSSAFLHDEPNYFSAHFDWGNKVVTIKADLPLGELPLSLSTSEFSATQSRVNVWKVANWMEFLVVHSESVQGSWPGSSWTFSSCSWPWQSSPQASRLPPL